MSKLVAALFYLFFLYVILQLILLYISKGHQIVYVIENEQGKFDVYEEYVSDKKDSHYYFEIDVIGEKFYFQTYHNFYKAENVIKDIGYVNTDTAKCLLPVFAFDQIVFDALCHYDSGIYNYSRIKGLDNELDEKMALIHESYDTGKYEDNAENILDEGFVAVHTDHVLDNHYVYVDSYRGVDSVNKNSARRITAVNFFNKDIYQTDLKILVNEYLLIADYNRELDFNKFWVVDLTKDVASSIELPEAISFNSIIQGSSENLVFVYNLDNRKQYQININSGNVTEIGNVYLGVKVFKNDEWEWYDVDAVTKENILFSNSGEVYNKDDFWLIKYVLDEKGYIYYVYKDDDMYTVYQALARKPEYMKYLFQTNEPKNIVFNRDYVYYKERLYLRYYHDTVGIKTLVVNQEFLFNEGLSFGLYIKR